MTTDNDNNNSIIDFLKNMTIPEFITKNIVTALGKGIHGVIIEASEIPKIQIRNYGEKIKLIGEIKREFIKKAAEHPLKQLETDSELATRALESYGIKLIEEQLNKEVVAGKTLETLKTIQIPENSEDKSISHDWLTSFWNLVGTKSEDEIQEILSKILANEIVQPGSISLHTLQTLSILDSKVGNSFVRLCNLSIDDGDMTYVIHTNVFSFQKIGDIDEHGITLNDLLYLEGANLIRSAESIMLNFAKLDNHVEGTFDYEIIDYASTKAKLDVSGKQLHLINFTQAGKELRRLIKMKPIDSYTIALQKMLGDNFVILE